MTTSTRHHADLALQGMTCAMCASRIEKALGKVSGVVSANVNLATERASVAFDDSTGITQLVDAVRGAGYDASVIDNDHPDPVRKDGTGALILAALLTAPLILPMVAGPFDDALMLPGWLQWLLATPVQFGFGLHFYRNAVKAVRGGTANMDVLVATGTSAAYGLSCFLLLQGPPHAHHLYFETSAAVITLVMFGKWLEQRAKSQGSAAIKALLALQPDNALVLTDGIETVRPLSAVVAGDVLVLLPGARIPVDGTIIEGRGEVDESLVTGESVPRARSVGDRVRSGSLNIDGRLCIRTDATGAASTLARIVQLVETAQGGKAPIQRTVDRISAVFVPVILAIAVLTLLCWGLATGNWQAAILNAVAVLVVACPCAMGLATPAAILVGTGVAARHGILIRDVQWLDQARQIDTVAFDKTGTLTIGKPTLQQVLVAGQGSIGADRALQIAATLQSANRHPLAQAVLALAHERALQPLALSEFRAEAGQGVEGVVHDVAGNLRTALISERWLHDLFPDRSLLPPDLLAGAGQWREQGRTISWLVQWTPAPQAIAVLVFGDTVKPAAQEAVTRLKAMGLQTLLISGDNRQSAGQVAAQLQIDAVHAEVLPEQKADIVTQLRHAGRRVAMVGDGINDAPALAAADIGIAMADGADIAMESAGITLMHGDPRLVAAALDIARRTGSKIRENLFWACIYNLIGVPLAAAGLLNPVWCGTAMAFSSVSVMLNALLLRRWRPFGVRNPT